MKTFEELLEDCLDIALKHQWHLGFYRSMPHVYGVYFVNAKNEMVSPLCQGHIDHDDGKPLQAALNRLYEVTKDEE